MGKNLEHLVTSKSKNLKYQDAMLYSFMLCLTQMFIELTQ